MKLVALRCGMTIEPASLSVFVGAIVQASLTIELAPATATFSARRSQPASADFQFTAVDPYSCPGGFYGAIAYLSDPAGPVIWDFEPTKGSDTLGYNLPTDSSYTVVLLRQDVDALMTQVASYNPNVDPGDLIPFMTNKL